MILPFLMTLFVLDRVFLIFIVWKNGYKFETWIYKDNLILESIHRVFVCLLIFALFLLFTSIW